MSKIKVATEREVYTGIEVKMCPMTLDSSILADSWTNMGETIIDHDDTNDLGEI